jgi:hypothetical protein
MNPSPKKLKESLAKKRYETPRLQIYGDLREITNTVHNLGSAHDDLHGNTRTA